MRMTILYIVVLGMAAGCSTVQNAVVEEDGKMPDTLRGAWILEVENLEHKTISTATIRFTDEKATSCLGGDWKRVAVESHSSSDATFFPVVNALSYELRHHLLTIGRNEVCDAYLHLSGELDDSITRGNYVAFGWGHQHKGYFSLRRGAE